MKKNILFLFFFTFFCISFAQKIPDKGVPEITSFAPSTFNNSAKIWDIGSAKNGILYFASEKGLLEFDGNNWRNFKGSKGFTRSVFVANDSLILTGSDMDFGLWKRDSVNHFQYHSLYPYKEMIRKESEEFWNTAVINHHPVFISHTNLYVLNKNHLTRIPAPNRFTDSFYSNSKLYLYDASYGLFEFDGNKLKLLFNNKTNKTIEIIGLFHAQNDLYLITKNNGLFKYLNGTIIEVNLPISKTLEMDKVFSFTQLDASHLAFGTILNGIYITDINGKIIHHINKQKGLLNNTILSMYYDPSGNLWAAMDYGISKINLKNRTNYFFDFKGNFGTGYCAILKDEVFYLGTNQGLYKTLWQDLDNDKSQNPLNLLPGSEGQVWCIKNIEGTVLVGHDLGLFKINGNSLTKINEEHGVWTIKPYNQDYFFTGNYNGVSLFKKNNGNWKFIKKINSIAGSCNQIEIQNQILWVNIPNYGILKVTLDQNFNPIYKTIFNTDHFKGEDAQLSKDKYGIHIVTSQYHYLYNEKQKRFLITNLPLSKYSVKDLLPFYNQETFLNSDYLFYPIYNGFALKNINKNHLQYNTYPLVFRGLKIFNNDDKKEFPISEKIPYPYNNLRLNFIVPQTDNVLYQHHFSDGKPWSSWTANHNFEFLNLKEGHYDFYVRALIDGKYSNTFKVSFYIKPPWYRSILAYFIYFLIFLGVFYGLKKRQENMLKKQELALLEKEKDSLRKQQEQYEQEKLILEQKRLEREQEILQQKVKDKTIELAQKAKEDDDKNRLLISVTEKVEELEKNPNNSNQKLKEIRRMLKNHLEKEDYTFEIQMDELHQEFFLKLKNKFPELSIYDLRLCAYLKIGLNSKEMSDILHVLPSSINVSRSRLRKKLGLHPEEDLFDFLNKI